MPNVLHEAIIGLPYIRLYSPVRQVHVGEIDADIFDMSSFCID